MGNDSNISNDKPGYKNHHEEIERLRSQAADLEQRLTRLQTAYDDLQQRFEERTTELEKINAALEEDLAERKRAEELMTKRANELETVARVSVGVSKVLNTGELLQAVVDMTKKNFNLYHAHIYLLNETDDILELAAGAGEVGRQMMAEGWRIPLDQSQSLVARSARTRSGVIVNEVSQAPDWLPNPWLPDTRSELAVPMIVGDQVLGVLDVQSEVVNRFTKEDAHIQTTLAAQVAVALYNTNLYEQTQVRAHREYLAREIGAKISSSMDLESVLKTTARELSQALGASRAIIRLGTPPEGDDPAE